MHLMKQGQTPVASVLGVGEHVMANIVSCHTLVSLYSNLLCLLDEPHSAIMVCRSKLGAIMSKLLHSPYLECIMAIDTQNKRHNCNLVSNQLEATLVNRCTTTV